MVVTEFLEAVDGLVAGVGVREELRGEQTQGDSGMVDVLPPLMADGAASGPDGGPREEAQEGEACESRKPLADGDEWDERSRCGRMVGIDECHNPVSWEGLG